ncbi:MAG: glycosyltransferase family 4 protein [Prevotellaceae bacterium]|nr:glycosyltransferase family 4 protein [Prevotellaceae bacterium]
MNKNILHIFASDTWGGGEQYVFDLAKKQTEAGCCVTLLSGKSEILQRKAEEIPCKYDVLRNRWHFNPFSICKMRRFMVKNKIKVVHVHQFKDAFIAVFAAKLIASGKRPKVILTRHLVKKGKHSRLYRWLYNHLDKLIFVSELAKNEFLSGVQAPDNKITVIHNSIPENIPVLQDIDYRKRFGLSRNCLLIGFIGRLVQYKGVEMLIDVAEKLRDRNIAFLLAGSGDKEYELRLQKIIKDKGLDTRFFLLGFLNNTAEFIAKMDVGILPSLWREPFGLSILEFMRAGIPVITTNTGAQPEFITHEETGLLVAPRLEEITDALIKLLDDKNFRNQIGKNAQLFYAAHLNYALFFNRIMTVYNA